VLAGVKRVKKIITGIALLIQISSAWAISNIENERLSLPENGLSGKINLSLDGKTGNQEERNNEASAKLIYRVDADIFLALVEKEYGSKHFNKDTDNSFLHLRWTHLLNDMWAAEAFTQREQDQFDNLTSRTLLGGGGRYLALHQKDSYSLVFGLGAFHENEKLNLITYQETNQLWRINSYYTYKYRINDNVMLVNTTYYQPSTRDWSDFRVLFETGLHIKLIKDLEISLNYKLTHDSQPAKNLTATPPIDNFKTNTEYKTSLSYSF
jgi:hypothetical protein